MKLIEVRTKMEKGGVIRLPKPEVENMKLEEGDEICLVYLVQDEKTRVNDAKEFILEKAQSNQK